MTIKEKMQEITKLQELEAPWCVTRVFGKPSMHGNQIVFGMSTENDFVTEQELQTAVEWLVQQLNGKVTWKKT